MKEVQTCVCVRAAGIWRLHKTFKTKIDFYPSIHTFLPSVITCPQRWRAGCTSTPPQRCRSWSQRHCPSDGWSAPPPPAACCSAGKWWWSPRRWTRSPACLLPPNCNVTTGQVRVRQICPRPSKKPPRHWLTVTSSFWVNADHSSHLHKSIIWAPYLTFWGLFAWKLKKWHFRNESHVLWRRIFFIWLYSISKLFNHYASKKFADSKRPINTCPMAMRCFLCNRKINQFIVVSSGDEVFEKII